jgi:hypothetical protein
MYEHRASNSQYRVVLPLRALEKRGHSVVWPRELNTDVPLRALLGCDLVHCYRRLGRVDDMRKLSERGVAVTFDNDDNFIASEVSEGGSGLEGHRYNKALYREMVKAAKIADLTTTTSPLLAEQFRAAGVEHVTVIENYLRRSMFGFGSRTKHDGVVVGWVAAREHRLDLERIPVAAALKSLLDIHPQLRVLTVGLRLPLSSERYEHVPGVPFRDLLTASNRMDIGIAPLADTPFNRSRSDAKIKEYSSAGAMWLASPVGPYRKLGEQQGGLLVADEDWYATIDGLLRDPRRRKRLAKRALKWAKTQTLEQHVQAWETAFLEAIERSQRRMGSAPHTRVVGQR